MLSAFIPVVPSRLRVTPVPKSLRSECPPGISTIPRPLYHITRRGVRRVLVSMEDDKRLSGNEVPHTSKRNPLYNFKVWYKNAMSKRQNLKASVLGNYGIAAFISYGFFDALTYSISFLISLRAYLAAGKTLTWNTLPQVLALMWGINNFSRPFRIAGAFALAPIVDRRVVKPVRNFLNRIRTRKSPSEE